MHKRNIVAFAILALLTLIPAVRAGHTDEDVNGRGFLWSPNFGWISLNCLNDWDDNPETLPFARCDGQGGDYGITLQVDGVAGEFTGFGWSPNLGLVCFGDTCRDVVEGGGMTPDGSPLNATFDFNDETRTERVDGKLVAFVTGWARIIRDIDPANPGDGGWIRLAGIPGTRLAENGGVGVRVVSVCVGGEEPDCEGGQRQSQFVIAGSAWQRNADGTGAGWIYFGDSPPGDVPDDDANASTRNEVPPGLRRYDTENQVIEGVHGCRDAIDNDQDDGINTKDPSVDLAGADCADYDCAPYPECPNEESGRECFDGIDNDLDAYVWSGIAEQYVENQINGKLPIDCGDPDCADAQLGERRCTQKELVENTYNGCYNGTDDDGDQRVDCDDLDCNSSTGFVLCPERAQGCVCVGHRAAVRGSPVCDDRNDVDSNDVDGDLIINRCDNCREVENSGQEDTDADGIHVVEGDNKGGDACDPVAWLQTEAGSLYAYELGGTPPPSGAQGFTATYCILTSGPDGAPTAFTSQFCDRSNLPEEARPPSKVAELKLERYVSDSVALLSANLLRARLDVAGLKAGRYGKVSELGPLGSGGQPLTLPASSLEAPEDNVRVYHHQGNLTLTGSAEFKNSAGTQSGARLILVENGDLTITGNFSYEALGANFGSNVRSLASIGFFVVNGNIKIDPAVSTLVGTYITSGAMQTGSGNVPLDIRGLVAAKRFKFERELASLTRGAERVTYDGRAALNPPPGFADFLKTLPTFRSIAPQ